MGRHITDEHGGLSIAIGTAANALKKKLNMIWMQLKSKSKDVASSSSCLPPHWYRSKFIPSEAELCLLVCSMFPDDFRIPIEDLVTYGMGLKLFEDVHDMFSARCRVHDLISLVNDLKYSRKVIGDKIRLAYEKDGHRNQHVKMLVGARDLAKLIASNSPLLFCRETVIDKWPALYWYKDHYGLSLVLKKIKVHPTNLKCPRLALLQLQYREDSQTIPIDFFEGMEELRVLSLDIPSLPQSLNLPHNLRTLRLKVVKFEDLSCIGGLTKLEFLSISTSSLTDIPREMGQLENLKLLDLKEMNIAYISPGVLSRMLKLEELYLPLSFTRWECKAKEHDNYDEWGSGGDDNSDGEEIINKRISEIDDGERINASLSEIASLSLTTLQISIPKALNFQKKSLIFKNIRVFKILVLNNMKYQPFGEDSINELQLTGDACYIIQSGICDLMSRTEKLSLTRVRNMKSVMYQLEDYDFPLLKKLLIAECDELEYVIDTTTKHILLGDDYSFCKLINSLHLSMLPNLKGIWHGRWTMSRWFEHLSHISIRFCHRLKFGFPLSIVRLWIQLKSIEILDCNEMEGVVYEDEDISTLMLGSVEKLDLHSLPKLIGFLVKKDNKTNGVHDDTSRSLTNNKIGSKFMGGSISTYDGTSKSFPTNENPARLNESWINDEGLICPPSTSASRGNLQNGGTQLLSLTQVSPVKNKDESFHVETYCVLPSKLAEIWLPYLKRLKIAFCDTIKVVFLFEENHAPSRAFDSLEELELYGLRNLEHIWFQIPPKLTAFQNLRILVLSKCHNSYLFSPRVAKLLVKLQKLCISRCKKMKEIIVSEDEEEVKDKIVFHQLKLLELQHMPNLRMFSSGIHEIELPLLDSLRFNQCNEMKYFSYGFLRTPMLKRMEVNGSLHLLTEDLNVTIKREANRNGQLFTFANLKIVTKNFSAEYLVGEGQFGGLRNRVRKGWIDEKTYEPSIPGTGMAVAIRKLNSQSEQELNECKSETYVERLWHPNVVKLLGYCWEDRALLLVYEYVQMGSLDVHLFGSFNASEVLSWDVRLRIAIGVARGLHFLHTSEPKVIHRNIKPSNILLDSNYNAKISDFRLANFGPSNGNSHVTTMAMGTLGYAAPEHVATGHLYLKSDVYSFGVVLLELMTGLRAVEKQLPKGQQNLVDWLKPILSRKRKVKTIIDARLEGQYSMKAMQLAAQLCLRCLESDPKSRPSMKEVVDALEQIDAIKEKPAGPWQEN